MRQDNTQLTILMEEPMTDKQQQISILNVDDDEASLYASSRILRNAGFNVIEATNGSDALRLVKDKPSLVLLDVQLPDINGFEVCQKIRSEPDTASIPILHLSATYRDSKSQVKGLDHGANGYLTAPVEAEVLISYINALLRVYQTELELKKYANQLEVMVEERTQELMKAQEQIYRRNRLASLGQLAGGVAHELRNPLGVITNAVYYLKLVSEKFDSNIIEHLELIEISAKEAANIISDLLDFFRIKSVNREQVHIGAIIDDVIISHPAPEGINLVLDISKETPSVFIDPSQIKRVFSNLVSNAYQAMTEGGELRIFCAECAQRPKIISGECIQVSIMDTGMGIAPDHISQIFEPLFTTKETGVGLGLALSKILVEANGGTIEVESEIGKGTTFILTLPLSL
jgi:signal transduction histidine kinase